MTIEIFGDRFNVNHIMERKMRGEFGGPLRERYNQRNLFRKKKYIFQIMFNLLFLDGMYFFFCLLEKVPYLFFPAPLYSSSSAFFSYHFLFPLLCLT